MRCFFPGAFFKFHPQRIIRRNEPNLDCFQHTYRQSDAENFGFVCVMVREKIDARTDRRMDGRTDRVITNIKTAVVFIVCLTILGTRSRISRRDLSGSVGIRHDPSRSAGIRRDPSGSVEIRRDSLGSARIRRNPSGSVGIGLDQSGSVGISRDQSGAVGSSRDQSGSVGIGRSRIPRLIVET